MNNIPRYFSQKLRSGEEAISLVRPFVLVYFWWWFISFGLIFGALYYMFFLFDFGIAGKVIFWTIIILGIFTLIKTLVVWRFTGALITEERLVDFYQHGFFSRQISEALFANIQDISMEQKGFWQLVFKFGTIKIQTAGSQNFLEIQHVYNPHKIHDMLVDVQSTKSKVIGKNTESDISNELLNDPDIQQLLKIFIKKKQEIGEKNFHNLLQKWLNDK